MQYDPTIDWHAKYEKLRSMTLEVLNMQSNFFKTRDGELLKKCKAKEKVLKEMCEEKKPNGFTQAQLEFLGR